MRLCAGYVLAAATVLTACGGGGGGGGSDASPSPAPVTPATSAEGFWSGKSSTGYDVSVAVLENGETWGVFGQNGSLYGALHGSTASSNGALTGTGHEFNLVSRTVAASSYTGTYAARSAIQFRLPTGVSVQGAYSAAYDQPASLATLAGTYTGSGVATGAPVQALSVTISAMGAVSSPPSLGCTASGSVVPRVSGKNVFDLRVTFSGASCALGDGASVSGVAYADSGNLLALGLLPSQTAGFIFTGKK